MGDRSEMASVGSFGGRAGARWEVLVRVIATIVVVFERVATATIETAAVVLVMKASVISVC